MSYDPNFQQPQQPQPFPAQQYPMPPAQPQPPVFIPQVQAPVPAQPYVSAPPVQQIPGAQPVPGNMTPTGLPISSTPQGVMVGVEPANPLGAAAMLTAPSAPQVAPIALVQPGQTPTEPTYSQSQVEGMLSTQLQQLIERFGPVEQQSAAVQQQIAELRQAEVARQQAAQQAAQQQADAQRLQEEFTLDAKALLARREQEWGQRFAQLEGQIQQSNALAAKEAELRRLDEYRTNRLAQAAGAIHPDLLEYVGGNSEAEIDESIQKAITKSQTLVQDFAQATGQVPPAFPQQQPMPGQPYQAPVPQFVPGGPAPMSTSAPVPGSPYPQVQPGYAPAAPNFQPAPVYSQPPVYMPGVAPVGGPPVGPLEQEAVQQSFSANDIANMDMDTYRRNRGQLLAAATQSYYTG